MPTVTTPSPTPTVPVVVVDGPGANAWEVVGAIGGAMGVLLAVFLAWYGGYQVRKERRIIHELDVLEDLYDRADGVGRGGRGMETRMEALRLRLLTVDPAACPVLRVFADAKPTPEGQRTYDALLTKANPKFDWFGAYPDATWIVIRTACRTEIEAAINARLHKRRRFTISQARVALPAPATCSPQRRLPYT